MGFLSGVVTGLALAAGAAVWYMSRSGERFRDQYQVDRKLGELGDELEVRTREIQSTVNAQIAEMRAKGSDAAATAGDTEAAPLDAVPRVRGRGRSRARGGCRGQGRPRPRSPPRTPLPNSRRGRSSAGEGRRPRRGPSARRHSCADVRWFARFDLDLTRPALQESQCENGKSRTRRPRPPTDPHPPPGCRLILPMCAPPSPRSI